MATAVWMVRLRDFEAGLFAESLTVAMTVYGPEVFAAGVPLNTPAALRLRPVGSPVADQVYPVPVPPVAVNVTEGYATPTAPAASDAGAVIVTAGFTVSAREFESVLFAESLTVALTVYGPCAPADGVPLNTPLVLRLMPEGSPVADHVYPVPVPPVAMNVTEVYATPTVRCRERRWGGNGKRG